MKVEINSPFLKKRGLIMKYKDNSNIKMPTLSERAKGGYLGTKKRVEHNRILEQLKLDFDKFWKLKFKQQKEVENGTSKSR